VKHIRPGAAPAPLGDVEQLVLLAILRLGDDAYGALIRRDIDARAGRDLAISTVHITIGRLEAKGLVRSRVGEPSPTRGGRRRKHVAIEPAGRRAIAHAYRQFRVMAAGLEREFET
jgi:PadR family transcriptional regulator, regulatory protein PadR